MNTKIKWIAHIPLIGGLPLGAEKAIGHGPEFITSLNGFASNDSHYINYQNNTLGRNVPYVVLDSEDREFKEKINIVVSTPPCAALSALNCGRNDKVKGAGCAKNEFMYITAEQAIKCYDADVIIGENAPALYTSKGIGVAENLLKIARSNGYSLTLYKTTTLHHGIPQNRNRTFYILWKSKNAPIMEWNRTVAKPWKEYLSEVTDDMLHQDEVINKKLLDEPFFNYVQHLNKGKDVRDVLNADKCNTCYNWVLSKDKLEDAFTWFKETDNTSGIKLAGRAIDKAKDNQGIWDSTVHVFDNHINAVIGRNMNDAMHPTHNRSLTIREALHLMGFPHNFELLGGRKNINHIAQNVPVCTAADIVKQGVLFLNNSLPMSSTDFIKQNNHNLKFDTELSNSSLSEFFAA